MAAIIPLKTITFPDVWQGLVNSGAAVLAGRWRGTPFTHVCNH